MADEEPTPPSYRNADGFPEWHPRSRVVNVYRKTVDEEAGVQTRELVKVVTQDEWWTQEPAGRAPLAFTDPEMAAERQRNIDEGDLGARLEAEAAEREARIATEAG